MAATGLPWRPRWRSVLRAAVVTPMAACRRGFSQAFEAGARAPAARSTGFQLPGPSRRLDAGVVDEGKWALEPARGEAQDVEVKFSRSTVSRPLQVGLS